MKLVAALLLGLFLLLGVQRTPEAQVGEIVTAVVPTVVAVGGCAYLAASAKKPDGVQKPQTETPATP